MPPELARSQPLFALLDEAELGLVLRHWARVELPLGEVLFRRGDPSLSLWALEAPAAVALYAGEPAESMPVALVQGGEVVGERALIRGSSHPLTAVVVQGGPALRVKSADFMRLREMGASAAFKLLRQMSLDVCRRIPPRHGSSRAPRVLRGRGSAGELLRRARRGAQRDRPVPRLLRRRGHGSARPGANASGARSPARRALDAPGRAQARALLRRLGGSRGAVAVGRRGAHGGGRRLRPALADRRRARPRLRGGRGALADSGGSAPRTSTSFTPPAIRLATRWWRGWPGGSWRASEARRRRSSLRHRRRRTRR